MRNTKAIGLVISALFAQSCQDARDEKVGQAASPVWPGSSTTVDSANQYSHIVAINSPGNATSCSGVLITPRWILSAAHCFGDAESDREIFFSHDLSGVFATHTFEVSGPILRRIPDPNNSNSNDSAQDLALMRLDDRVPSSVARPIHPPLTDNTCGTDFTGTIIGFGSNFHEPAPCFDILAWRRYSTHDGWLRFSFPDGVVYERAFANFYPLYCDQYSGIARGDSGGALIDDSGNLCGIINSYSGPGPTDPLNPFAPYLTSTAWLASTASRPLSGSQRQKHRTGTASSTTKATSTANARPTSTPVTRATATTATGMEMPSSTSVTPARSLTTVWTATTTASWTAPTRATATASSPAPPTATRAETSTVTAPVMASMIARSPATPATRTPTATRRLLGRLS